MINNIDELNNRIKELEAELAALKKYGLVWDKEKEKEKVVSVCENNMPVLSNVNGRNLFFGTQNNILIEGDNYHSLLVLNYIYKNKVDFIYIDPPYNTGNQDFSYNDRFINKDDGYRHSTWLNMMSKRLQLAKELLSENGSIFISIDDNEFSNLKLLCDSIFGESNFLSTMIWKSKSGGANDSAAIASDHEYILAYAKNSKQVKIFNDMGAKVTTSYNYEDEHGRYALDRLDKQSLGYHESLDFPITGPDGRIYRVFHKNPEKKQARWRWGSDTVAERYNELVFKWPYVYTKNYEKKTGQTPRTILFDDRFGRTRTGSTDLRDVIGVQSIFTYPKPVNLIKYLIQIACPNDGLVLDFFAGSGTTGQAVMDLNSEDNGNRRFILCTNNENKICEEVTYKRLKTIISGKRDNGDSYNEQRKANLYYYKTDFIPINSNSDQTKYILAEKIDNLLCILEDCFEMCEQDNYSSHYSNKGKHLFIYNDLYNEQRFSIFKNKVESSSGDLKIVYVYTNDFTINEKLFSDVNVVVKPMPLKIYEIYKNISEKIRRGE